MPSRATKPDHDADADASTDRRAKESGRTARNCRAAAARGDSSKSASRSGCGPQQLDTQIRPLLTPDQQKRLDAMETLHGTGVHGSE